MTEPPWPPHCRRSSFFLLNRVIQTDDPDQTWLFRQLCALFGAGLLRVALNIELCKQEEKGEDVPSVDDHNAGRVALAPAGSEQKREEIERSKTVGGPGKCGM